MSDAEIVARVAAQMVATYGEQAVVSAWMRAEQLKDEPRAAARWREVGDTIAVLCSRKLAGGGQARIGAAALV